MNQHPECMSKAAFILKLLYDLDLLEEEAILKWAKALTRKYVDKSSCRLVHQHAKQFVRWLQ